MNLPDMQKATEGFKQIPIKKVGMRNIELPLKIFHTGINKPIEVKGLFSSYCNLVEETKGINMSRISRTLIDVLESNDFTVETNLFTMMEVFAQELKTSHGTDDIFAKVKFDYPIYTDSPYTKLSSPEYTNLTLEVRLSGNILKRFLTISRVGMSLCPCSKEMSLLINNITEDEIEELDNLSPSLYKKLSKAGYGAHNQRSHIDVTVEVKDPSTLNLEEFFQLIDSAFSCPTKTVLKRPDEKVITEVSYLGGYFTVGDGDVSFTEVEGTGPKFVEDIARDVAFRLNDYLDTTISDYIVVVNNDESIHSGDILATAILSAGRSLE